MQQARSRYMIGAGCGVAAAAIWAGWSVLTRLAVTTDLDAWDIAALRFGVAGVLLAPIVLRCGLARDRLGWLGLGTLIAGAGVPYTLLAAGGLRFAPAHHQAALNPGTMPLFVALIAVVSLQRSLPRSEASGLLLILVGVLVIIGGHGPAWSAPLALGHALFLCAALLWACFTVVSRQAGLDPLHATALVSSGSLLLYLPIYVAMHGVRLGHMPVAELALQVIFQGLLVTIVSLLLYGRAVVLLGASRAAAFGALVPPLSAAFAVPLLGEWPDRSDVAAIALVSAGVYLASGGLLPSWARRGAS
jgi:drug/metabolite transporter (DMT)-like permease